MNSGVSVIGVCVGVWEKREVKVGVGVRVFVTNENGDVGDLVGVSVLVWFMVRVAVTVPVIVGVLGVIVPVTVNVFKGVTVLVNVANLTVIETGPKN